MAFGILLRNPDTLSIGAFEALLEDTAYTLVQAETGVDWESPQSVSQGFGKRPPKAVVNFLSGTQKPLFVQQLAEISALAEVCRDRGIPLLHISGYEVYGESDVEKGWRESDEPEPTNALGRHLLALEEELQNHTEHIIIRPSWILEGPSGVLDSFLPPLLEQRELVVSDHRYASPISRRFLMRTIFAMIQQVLCGAQNWGVFNLHSSDRCSEAEFADQICRLLVNEFKLEVSAPTVAGPGDEGHLLSGSAHLLGRRCTSGFGIQMPTWRSGFARVVKSWLDEQKSE